MSTVNVVFVSAGNIMFGTPEGPWNHSIRLERKLGDRLRVVAVIDPNTDAAHEKVAAKKEGGDKAVAVAYSETGFYASLDEFVKSGAPEKTKPEYVPCLFRVNPLSELTHCVPTVQSGLVLQLNSEVAPKRVVISNSML